MRIAMGADHAGFQLKEHLRRALTKKGYEVVDYGTDSTESSDYPDFAAPVARAVAAGMADRGILVCSTGVGMSIAANKVAGIRAALATSAEEVGLARTHNDANVLTLGARYTDAPAAEAFAEIFLTAAFDGGRHRRRLAKVAALERAPETPGVPVGEGA
jgi:ribose 5-phosphate isomerase B